MSIMSIIHAGFSARRKSFRDLVAEFRLHGLEACQEKLDAEISRRFDTKKAWNEYCKAQWDIKDAGANFRKAKSVFAYAVEHELPIVDENGNVILTTNSVVEHKKAALAPAPVAKDKAGGKLNVNADSAAGKVAAEVGAEKLVVVSDTHGILADLEDPSSTASSVDEAQIKDMINSRIITEAMFPKVEACLTALDAGVKKAHIIDGRIEHSLLLEIYNDKGIGTQIVKK